MDRSATAADFYLTFALAAYPERADDIQHLVTASAADPAHVGALLRGYSAFTRLGVAVCARGGELCWVAVDGPLAPDDARPAIERMVAAFAERHSLIESAKH